MSSRGRSAGRPAVSRAGRAGAGGRAPGGGRARSGGGPRIDQGARRERLREVVAPVVAAAGYDLEDLTVARAGRRHLVRVVVDADGGVTLDAVAEVSRAVSAALDAAEEAGGDLFEGEYALEVGSPGVDRPLTLPRHWRRNVGRLVKVSVRADDGDSGPARPGERQVTGRVLAADDEGVVLDVDGAGQDVPYERLGAGRVQIEFNRLDIGSGDEESAGDAAWDEDVEEER